MSPVRVSRMQNSLMPHARKVKELVAPALAQSPPRSSALKRCRLRSGSSGWVAAASAATETVPWTVSQSEAAVGSRPSRRAAQQPSTRKNATPSAIIPTFRLKRGIICSPQIPHYIALRHEPWGLLRSRRSQGGSTALQNPNAARISKQQRGKKKQKEEESESWHLHLRRK